jgi:hypothetical protein
MSVQPGAAIIRRTSRRAAHDGETGNRAYGFTCILRFWPGRIRDVSRLDYGQISRSDDEVRRSKIGFCNWSEGAVGALPTLLADRIERTSLASRWRLVSTSHVLLSATPALEPEYLLPTATTDN